MQEHSAIGERILREVDAYETSQPSFATTTSGSTARAIPTGSPARHSFLSRVIAVADAYNAMTSTSALSRGNAAAGRPTRLAQAVESQFDTSVVAAFEAILASANEGYRSATSEEFRPGQPSVAESARAAA